MEENILEKKENEVASNNNSNKNGIIAILIVIIIALIGAVIYFAVIKKDEQKTDNNGGNNQQQQNNNTNEQNQKKGDVILAGDDGYYVSYIDGSTRLFDKDDKELAILDNKKLSINSITGFWDIDDEANMLYIGINLAYKNGEQYCIENDKEVESYSYYFASGKVIKEGKGVCKNNLIEKN